jgi:hypothetical protein
MSAKPQQPALRTAATILARLQEVGVLLAAGRGFRVAGCRELSEEHDRLVGEYRAALDRESAPPSAETLRQAREHEERQARVAKALADATR